MFVSAAAAAAFYAGLNIGLTLVLAFLVIRQRRKAGVNMGDGGNEALACAIRAHANNVEYVAVILPGLVVLALIATPILLIHLIGVLLTVGRVLHAIGLSRSSGTSVGRFAGTLFTWIAMALTAVFCVLGAFGV